MGKAKTVAQQSIKNGFRSRPYICNFLSKNYVFQEFPVAESTREANVLRYGRVVDNTSLRHVFSAVKFPARACTSGPEEFVNLQGLSVQSFKWFCISSVQFSVH